MQRFIGRQPILDARSEVFGYELLFRDGVEPFFNCEDGDQASSNVMDRLLFSIKTLTDGRRAFINFTKNRLLDQSARLLNREEIVIEVLENVEPTADVVEACKALKQQGYLIALDDFIFSEEINPLVDLADIIKVDFLATGSPERKALAQYTRPRGIKLLAEKVETHEEHREAMGLGYVYFQGYFFSKPEIIEGRDVPPYKQNYVLLMQAINRKEPDFREIEEIIKRDPSISFRLLRYLNSAAFAFTCEVQSIKMALSLVGMDGLFRLFSVMALAGLAKGRPPVLVISSLVRAKLCEALASMTGFRGRVHDLFLIGLLSELDAILQCPMSEILEKLSIPIEVRSTLLGEATLLSIVLELVLVVEKGDWEKLSSISHTLCIDEGKVSDAYLQSVQSANEIFQLGR
jgi:EAL and modified HD-GYP domain-containing signal transduction protein